MFMTTLCVLVQPRVRRPKNVLPAAHATSYTCLQAAGGSSSGAQEWPETRAVLHRGENSITRLAGDRYVFLEIGPMVLDFGVRAQIAEIEKWLGAHAPAGFVESSPGVRSVLLEYDADKLSLAGMLKLVQQCDPLPQLLHHIRNVLVSACLLLSLRER